MTESSLTPLDSAAASSARYGFALRTLGVGLFVSSYLHAVAVPGASQLANHASASLFPPRRDRASVALALSLPSRASAGSAEAAIRSPEAVAEGRGMKPSDSVEDAKEALDTITTAPVSLERSSFSATSSNLESDFREEFRSSVDVDPPSAPRIGPVSRRLQEESIAARITDQVAEAPSVPRSPTIDSPAQAPSEIRLGAESETMPETFDNPPPLYPPDALRDGVQGRAVIRTRIGRRGEVLATAVHESSGSDLLDRAAEEAVRRWRFRPGLRFGLAVEEEVGVPVVFSIREALAAQDAASEQAQARALPANAARPAPARPVGR